MNYAWDITFIIISFFLGSIPFGKIIANFKGVDITKVGSGNIGATNVFRSVGKFWGIIVLILDALKGMIPTYLTLVLSKTIPFFLPEPYVFVGIAAILGHMFSPFMRFEGGKGVATSLGVFLILTPIGTVIGVAVFTLLLIVFRIVSISSIAATIAVFAYVLIDSISKSNLQNSYILISTTFIIMVLIIVRHLPNFKRLMKGEEKKII